MGDCELEEAQVGVVEVVEGPGADFEDAVAVGVAAKVGAVREADVGLEVGVVGCQCSEIEEFVQV